MTASGVTDPSFRSAHLWEQQRAVVQAVGINVAGTQVRQYPRVYD